MDVHLLRPICFGGILFLAAVCCSLQAACTDKLETGYAPARLDMTAAQERALYADPFSKDAQAAQQEQADEAKERRPTP